MRHLRRLALFDEVLIPAKGPLAHDNPQHWMSSLPRKTH